MQNAANTLDDLEANYEVKIISAHRTPARLTAFTKTAHDLGFAVIIAGAGGAAHLPGMLAANTHLPVLGVPIESTALQGMDSLLSIVQMPAGVPLAHLLSVSWGEKRSMSLSNSRLSDPHLAKFKNSAPNKLQASPKPLETLHNHGYAHHYRYLYGQLGRMLVIAAAQLGIKTHIFAPDASAARLAK